MKREFCAKYGGKSAISLKSGSCANVAELRRKKTELSPGLFSCADPGGSWVGTGTATVYRFPDFNASRIS